MKSVSILRFVSLCLGLSVSLATSRNGLGQNAKPIGPKGLEKLIVCENTAAVVKVETSKIRWTASQDAKGASGLALLPPNAQQRLQQIQTLASNEDAYAAIDIPYSMTPFARFYVKDIGEAALQELQSKAALPKVRDFSKVNGYLGFSTSESMVEVEKLMIKPSVERVEFSDAFQTVSDYPVQCAIAIPEYVRRTVSELMPRLPDRFGGGPSSVFTAGARWIAIGFDPSTFKVVATIQSESNTAAGTLASQFAQSANAIISLLPDDQKEQAKSIYGLLSNAIKSEVVGSQVQLQLDMSAATALAQQVIAPLYGNVVSEISQSSRTDQFREIALACHNFESANGTLPPGKSGRDAQGKSLLSWRVHILPFLGEANLYNQFHLNEPWDSPHNITLLDKMPKVFLSDPADAINVPALKPGYTTIVAPIGKDTVFGQNKPVGFSSITDGTSNTVWLVEVKPERAVPWTAPMDYSFDPKAPAAGLSLGANGKYLMGLVDGSVFQVDGKSGIEVLLNLFYKSDGNVVELK